MHVVTMRASNINRSDSLESITSSLRAHARQKPNQTALICLDDSISWDQLNRSLDCIAASLREQYPDGEIIAVYLPNSPALVLIFLAGVRAGYNMQVFDHEWPRDAVYDLLSASDVVCVFAELPLETDTDVIEIAASKLRFDQVVAAICKNTKDEFPTDVNHGGTFYTGFTSGSSGTPKGFCRDQASWLSSFENEQHECPLSPQDVIVAPGALSHSLFMYALVRGLHAGASVIFSRRFAVTKISRLINQHKATVLYAVPAHIQLLIKTSRVFSSVRYVLSSGAKWPEQMRDVFAASFPRAELCEFYGASELSFVAISKNGENRPVNSVGRAFYGVDVSVRSADGQERLPCDTAGDVFVKSNMLFRGYANAASGCTVAHDGALSVGDVGCLDAASNLFLLGRADRMLVCSGKNVYPEEIERVLIMHEIVNEVAVLGVTDSKRGHRLLAVIECDSSGEMAARDLIAHSRRFLPAYKIPSDYRICSHWPRTRSGKTDLQKLSARIATDGLSTL